MAEEHMDVMVIRTWERSLRDHEKVTGAIFVLTIMEDGNCILWSKGKRTEGKLNAMKASILSMFLLLAGAVSEKNG